MSEIDARGSSHDGFAGTVPAFLEWIDEQLRYGVISIGEPMPDKFRENRLVRQVRLVTGGYSDDERLLGRVHADSMFSTMFWRSTHRGGLYVYEVPVEHFDSDQRTPWLDQSTNASRRRSSRPASTTESPSTSCVAWAEH